MSYYEDLPKPPPGCVWAGGTENFADGKSTRHLSLIDSFTGKSLGYRRIAVELYGRAGVREAALDLIGKAGRS